MLLETVIKVALVYSIFSLVTYLYNANPITCIIHKGVLVATNFLNSSSHVNISTLQILVPISPNPTNISTHQPKPLCEWSFIKEQ